ncbi:MULTISPECIES: FKBP-type peptidyl-prolyl cis-trans isomerase [unclassified Pedobacter]|uniref:FKBP-type peptidyl-prolyl cis-trans isomerase n=1 Tax=unclassified Pedobacter TaxID=2628915 RepID=UPI001E2FA031|nr:MULTISPECIES: FKBP-type peptidyl-prolyl cis-trans isomerase [unclassified Pedobacter]
MLVLLAAVIFTSCKKNEESIQVVDDAAIQTYIKQNNLTMTKDVTGYYYNITALGNGVELKNPDSIFYSYTFKTLSGTVLNQSDKIAIPGTFLGYSDRFVINGSPYTLTPVREVLSKLKRGGKANVIIPSNLAFGRNGIAALGIESNENILVELGIYTQAKRHELDDYLIDTFLAANSLTAIKDPSRVRYIVTQQGTGTDPISNNSTISVNYTGRFLNGTSFDKTDGTPLSFELLSTIAGWQILKNFKAGTKVRIFVPSDLGYGTSGSSTGTIPPNTNLDFDIEIVSVKN